MNEKRGQGISVTTIIIVILAILVLVILVLFFTGGMAKMGSKIAGVFHRTTATEVDEMIDTCNTYCTFGSEDAFCNNYFEVRNMGNVTCCQIMQQYPERLNCTKAFAISCADSGSCS